MNATTERNLFLDNFTAIEFLAHSNGFFHKPILLMNVSWTDYEHFLDDFEEKAGWRLAYSEGNLEIMPPLMEHETPSRVIDKFVWAYCEHFDLTVESAGSTTYRRKSEKKGVEPDASFYIQNADKIIGKSMLVKPDNYPLPDVAVEIDITHGSLDKFPIYAALQVPEVWIYDGEAVSFYELEAQIYHQISHSRALPLLSAEKLTGFLAASRTKGQTFALKSFREWLREQK